MSASVLLGASKPELVVTINEESKARQNYMGMLMKKATFILVSGTFLSSVSIVAVLAQTAATPHIEARITQRIDESAQHLLAGNTRSEATTANDRGKVADTYALNHMMLQLQRSPAQEQAFKGFIDTLHDSKSPNFQKWLSADQIGERYGVAQSDIDKVTGWLEAKGFTVNSIFPSRMTIDFSGNAGQVSSAFHTEIHKLSVEGKDHIGNMSDPEIPEALAPVVAGVVSLSDFKPRAMRRAAQKPRPDYTATSNGSVYRAVVPGDLATIYDLNPLFTSGVTGQGQTIAVIEDSDLYSSADWTTFRTTFGLSQYTTGTLTSSHPAPRTGRTNCAAPGVTTDDVEAALDAEWASASAPGAAVLVAACADSNTTFGLFIATQNLLNATAPPSIISMSYGECEAYIGATLNASITTMFQQAVAEGVSVFVSSGDNGAAGCDGNVTAATHGIGVSGFASTAYNVAVGGTDFSDFVNHTASTYWNSTNTSTFNSAISYIPEIPWNASCAGSVLSNYMGYSTGYGSGGYCASALAAQYGDQVVAAGSGGPSGCATGVPASSGVVGGTCQGYAKPSWQTGVSGIPADGVRGLPDVSMFASSGVFNRFYVFCFTDTSNGGYACTGAPLNWSGAGGTSFAAPILAGIQALVNQKMGALQGNPNPVYYKLAASSFAGSVFHPITTGDIAVNCAEGVDCFSPTFQGRGRGANYFFPGNGVLSTSSQSLSPAFSATNGWNFATGLGSVDANNLVTNWKSGQ